MRWINFATAAVLTAGAALLGACSGGGMSGLDFTPIASYEASNMMSPAYERNPVVLWNSIEEKS